MAVAMATVQLSQISTSIAATLLSVVATPSFILDRKDAMLHRDIFAAPRLLSSFFRKHGMFIPSPCPKQYQA